MAESARFLGALAPRGLITYQTFDDGPQQAQRLACIRHGAIADRFDELAKRNDRGAGVFVMVNQGDGKGRSAKNVVSVRAVFVDLDSAPLLPVLRGPLAPSITVESSPGKFHAYWLVDDFPLGEFRSAQAALAARFHGDPTVKDLGRVMRLPGFEHRKRSASPFLTRILSLEGFRYSATEIVEAFGPFEKARATPQGGPLKAAIPEGKRNQELFKSARGFINRGITLDAANRRLQRINAERCQPPLCATEVDEILRSAATEPSKGSLSVPFALLDDQNFQSLKLSPQALVLAALRRQAGNPATPVSLPFEDFKGRIGNKAFYRYRKALVAKGILLPAGKAGDADLFTVRVSK